MDIKKIPPYKHKPYVSIEHPMSESPQYRNVIIHSKVSFRPYNGIVEGFRTEDPVNIIPDALQLFEDAYEHYNGKWLIYS